MAEFDSSEKLPTTACAIDPALLTLSNNTQVPSPLLEPARAPAALPPSSVIATRPELDPTRDATGLINASREEYATQLLTIKRKIPLQDRCRELGLKLPTPTTLDRLRYTLQNYWFPPSSATATAVPSNSPAESSSHEIANSHQDITPPPLRPPLPDNATPRPFLGPEKPPTPSQATLQSVLDQEGAEETALVQHFDVEGADAEAILGFDDEKEDEEDVDEENGFQDLPNASPELYKAFQASVRVQAASRAEGNRRKGGLATQKAMVRAWLEFVETFLKSGMIKDSIVDEHSLLLFIKFSAERPKRNRRGIDIPGTFVGASQLKKLFFGALRIRKEQDAADITLVSHRRATTVGVWDAIKNRMNEALDRERSGLVPNEDAPDITANTFLADITPEELAQIGRAFLSHREVHPAINGHLAWALQHATGNRGDDVRALRLAELQPAKMLHPNKETEIPVIYGLQGEDKAGKRGMKTTINPFFTSFIAHRQAEMCPIGALAILHHYLYDVRNLATMEQIDWSLNKSWRQIRVLHSSKSMTSGYSDQSLYRLYVNAFRRAEFDSPRLKVHFARHTLGYKQEQLGVDSNETGKLGWLRGKAYDDTYRPAIPKKAVLGCHGYKEHEQYDPVWRHVHVPEVFLRLMCPMAEEIIAGVQGGKNLRGTTRYWQMVVFMRPFLFQSAAAIFKICPNSAIFKQLPALADRDVQNWMATTYQSELCALQAQQGSPIDIQRIQDQMIRTAIEEVRALQSKHTNEIGSLIQLMERRTSVFSPTKGFSTESYHRSSLFNSTTTAPPNLSPCEHTWSSMSEAMTLREDSDIQPDELDSTGVYQTPDSSLRAFVTDSPKTPTHSRAKTQVDLVLPPLPAFNVPGPSKPVLLWPPVLGQQGVNWTTIFKHIKQPAEVWERWKPARTLDAYETVENVWNLFTQGEAEYGADGTKTGMKPPLYLVEQHFASAWRTGANPRKIWQRFREIPDWIDARSKEQGLSPAEVIDELEAMRGNGGNKKGLNALSKVVKDIRIKRKIESETSAQAQLPPSSPSPPAQSSSPEPSISKKRRAAPLAPRKRAKIPKI